MNFKIVAWFELEVRDKQGFLKEKRKIKNTLTYKGLSRILDFAFGLDSGGFVYIAVGEGTKEPSPEDTSLESEVKRKKATVSKYTTEFENDSVKLETTFVFDAPHKISEAGVFDAVSNGIMLSRAVFKDPNTGEITPISVDAGDLLTVRWYYQISMG